jgi:hypothetical protein
MHFKDVLVEYVPGLHAFVADAACVLTILLHQYAICIWLPAFRRVPPELPHFIEPLLAHLTGYCV